MGLVWKEEFSSPNGETQKTFAMPTAKEGEVIKEKASSAPEEAGDGSNSVSPSHFTFSFIVIGAEILTVHPARVKPHLRLHRLLHSQSRRRIYQVMDCLRTSFSFYILHRLRYILSPFS